jgi:20S proteasome alpha/beta subunit
MNNKNVRYDENNKLKRKSRLTVCIVAINNGAIIGASDRMITAGDIEFEPSVSKILPLTSSIAILTAGDQSIQMQVYQRAYKIIAERVSTEPNKWIDVSFAVEVYSRCFYNLRKTMIENSILSSYNLTLDSFIARNKEMSENLINEINNRIRRFTYELEGIETIIAGVDNSIPHMTKDGTSAHIYTVKDGEISCHDKLGFASIGYGSNHALSHFMLSKYTKFIPEPKALLTIHQAKKKSEVSPGVGKETDMFFIAGLGQLIMFDQLQKKDIVKDLDDFYDKYIEKIEESNKEIEEKIANYFNEMIKKIPKSEQEPSVSPSASIESEPELKPKEK